MPPSLEDSRLADIVFVFVLLYFGCMMLGLWASLVLDVQWRLPGIRQVLGLVVAALLLWGILWVTHRPFTDVLVPLVWAGTGLLAGLGSRGHQSPG